MIGMVFWLGPGRAVVDAANGSGSSRSLLSGGENTCVDYSDAELEWYWCIVYALVLLYALVGLAVVCDEFFVASLELISERLNLSDDVAGATFMAAGSSAPELFTSVVDTFWSENNVGIGTIVGSAVFNILVIIAVSAAASAHPLHIDWRPLSRDSFFYLISIVLLILFMLPESSAPDGCKEHPGAVSWYTRQAVCSTPPGPNFSRLHVVRCVAARVVQVRVGSPCCVVCPVHRVHGVQPNHLRLGRPQVGHGTREGTPRLHRKRRQRERRHASPANAAASPGAT